TALDEYLPVPTMRREGNVFPAVANVSGAATLPSADEVDDLDLVSLVHDDAIEGGALDHGEVVFDGDAGRVDLEARQQLSHAHGRGELEAITVQLDRHECVDSSASTAARDSSKDGRMQDARLVEWYTRNRARSRALFDLLGEDTYYSRPIAL